MLIESGTLCSISLLFLALTNGIEYLTLFPESRVLIFVQLSSLKQLVKLLPFILDFSTQLSLFFLGQGQSVFQRYNSS
jgi:hypothetical protein